jgi:hypothetical protein
VTSRDLLLPVNVENHKEQWDAARSVNLFNAVKNVRRYWIATITNASVTVIQENACLARKNIWYLVSAVTLRILSTALYRHIHVTRSAIKYWIVDFINVKRNAILENAVLVWRLLRNRRHVLAENMRYKC